MRSRIACFALFLVVAWSANLEAKPSRKKAVFPPTDTSRITALQIYCDGGECDDVYINQHLQVLERHFRIAQCVVEEEYAQSHQGIVKKVGQFFLKFNVVPLDTIKSLLRQDPARNGVVTANDLVTPLLVGGEAYFAKFEKDQRRFRKDGKKYDVTPAQALNAYIREVSRSLDDEHRYPSEKKVEELHNKVVKRGRGTIDAEFLRSLR